MTTEQDKQIDMNRNPNGKGGFGDNPENINVGGRPKNQESFTYWLNYFKGMSVKEFIRWPKNVSEEDRSMASELAYARMFGAINDLNNFKVIADRTEGYPKQAIEYEGTMDHILTFHEVVKLIDENVRASEDNDEVEK